tara:strand:+ start:112 stop:1128 length:1017 start_codon:yes stop_codon:yes gene_type:complete
VAPPSKVKDCWKNLGEVTGVLVFLLVLFLGTVSIEANKAFHYKSKNSATLFIPPGTPLQEIAFLLKKEDLILSAFYFEWYVRLLRRESPLQAGEYEVAPGLSMASLVDQMQSGKTKIYALTIPEGLMSLEIVQLLEAEKSLTSPLTKQPDEGTLLPETYHYHKFQTRDDLVNRMQQAQQRLIEPLWLTRDEDLPITTRQEAIILASIVERETSIPSERRRIASVFMNRLQLGMPLQSDPTVRYGLYKENNKLFEGPLYRKHLKHATPYNTYLIQGLPPGPICHPGRASIKAVLTPEKTKDLYFVADGTGGHLFSRTYKEHRKNHEAWRQLRRQRLMQK